MIIAKPRARFDVHSNTWTVYCQHIEAIHDSLGAAYRLWLQLRGLHALGSMA